VETRKLLDCLPGIIDKAFPLPARFRAALPRDISELFRLLTSERKERGSSYLGKPGLLSAYLRYYLPWNIYRLCRLFSSLPLELKPTDALNDLGAGPLTLAVSLWISRPELRGIPLEFRCLDRTAAVLEAGRKFFAALAGTFTGEKAGYHGENNSPWKIRTIRGGLRMNGSLSVEIKGKAAALSAAVNVYNELFWNFSPMDTEGLACFANNHARLLSSLTESSGSVLVVEPGIPRSGEFISLLRSVLLKEGRVPLSPCPHIELCPLPGGRAGKAKWCHFAFDTADAPEELHRLSAAAHLPKERAALSFILTGPQRPEFGAGQITANQQAPNTNKKERLPAGSEKHERIRVISDSFPVTGNSSDEKNIWGRYGCCEQGLVLVTGSKRSMESSPSGELKELVLLNGKIDTKSGARLAPLTRS
jgi:hypothetical protein